MTLIRGATTIEKDEKDCICTSVKELLDEVFAMNRLNKKEVTGIFLSVTSDIHSFHPAKAARMGGYEFAPLFTATEPNIENGLPLTIRVAVLTDENIKDRVKHIYLRGAKMLRKDLTDRIAVALDGPAGSGKSTIAKRLADDFKILYLDTGAMYRACGLYALRRGVDPKDENAVNAIIPDIRLEVKYEEGTQHTYLDGEDVSLAIRQNEVSLAASSISAHPCIREKMVDMQRIIAKQTSCILDGRDIGSVVLPDAEFKFFVTAKSEVRAQRRVSQLEELGQKADYEKILEEIILRDKQDTERKFSPLIKADDAILIDTSEQSVEETIATIKSYIEARI